MSNFIQKAFQKNAIVKPLAVVTASAPSVTYLLTQSSELFTTQPIEGTDLVAISTELIKSFQGALLLLILLISIINIYKPSKIIIFTLVFGGITMVASALLKTIGMTFLTYGIGLLINNFTLNPLMLRNAKLKEKQTESTVDKIIREASK